MPQAEAATDWGQVTTKVVTFSFWNPISLLPRLYVMYLFPQIPVLKSLLQVDDLEIQEEGEWPLVLT
ncbi:hypothetical protein N7513_001848 [Penicillium frequentans]|nr:hypothetical protein N7513_001848 [Penicillium glabrum]